MRVLISGAGIAGTTLAYWLAHYGYAVTVVEKAAQPREGGYKIDVRGPAIDVVKRMGVFDAIKAHETGVDRATFVDRRGRRLADMDADLFMFRNGDDLEVMRGTLARILYEATPDTVEYLFGDSVTGIDFDGSGRPTVRFAHSASREFDLIIGADGMHSQVRHLTFGEETQFLKPLGHNVAVLAVTNHLGLDREERLYCEPGRTLELYSTRGQTDARALFLFRSAPTATRGLDDAATKRMLAQAVGDMGWEVPRILSELSTTADFYFDQLATVVMDTWSHGPVALLGDAAHCATPASGQGTSLALVGAYVLAGELAAAHGDHQTAFRRYEEIMRPFAEANQRLADNIRQMVLGSRLMIRAMVLSMRILPKLPVKAVFAKKIQEQLGAAVNGITLPSYQDHVPGAAQLQ
jgi:2-polyprenyl-6-methoxyphenol hydroxylase-like FAD-dependent oxidoreductase